MTDSRRDFLRKAGLAVASAPLASAQNPKGVSIAVDPGDAAASAAPVLWAAGELEKALTAAGVRVRRCERPGQSAAGEFCIVASSVAGPAAPVGPESLVLVNAVIEGRSTLVARGGDTRGLVFALLDVADRVRLMPLD